MSVEAKEIGRALVDCLVICEQAKNPYLRALYVTGTFAFFSLLFACATVVMPCVAITALIGKGFRKLFGENNA